MYQNTHRVSGIDEIINQDADTIRYVAYEDHTRALAVGDLGWAAFLNMLVFR